MVLQSTWAVLAVTKYTQQDGLFIQELGYYLRVVLCTAVYGVDMKVAMVAQSTVLRYHSICEQDEVDHTSSSGSGSGSGSGSDTDNEQDAVAERNVTATVQYALVGVHEFWNYDMYC